MSKLIIIRGNSGSGKTSTANLLREKLDGKVALLEQDIIRRRMLGEVNKGGDDNVDLIKNTASFALDKEFTVILEGILPTKYYGGMLQELCEIASETVVVYFDISLEETLRRHETKPNKSEFGESQMRDWYEARDYLNYKNEIIITEDTDQADAVDIILNKTRPGRKFL